MWAIIMHHYQNTQTSCVLTLYILLCLDSKMRTLANREDPDEMHSSGSKLFATIKTIFRKRNTIYLEIITCLIVWFDSLRPINNLSVIKGWVFLSRTSTKLGLMFLLKDTTQWRRGLSVSSQALYHWATALLEL